LKALILAAGLGSRLMHETKDLPKALVQVSGKAILSYQLDALISNSIHNIIIVLGKKGSLIKDFIARKYPNIRVTYVENLDYECTNSSYSFWLAREYVSDDQYIHLNCDIIFSGHLLRKIIESRYENVIAIRTDIELDGRMEYVSLNDNRICQMSINKFDNAKGKAFGLAKLSKESINKLIERLSKYINDGDRNQNFYGMIREEVVSDHYHAINCDNSLLLEVNTINDLNVAKGMIK
jgi:choline kinase